MRLLVLGNGGSGKSTFARLLSEETGVPCIELDKVFWSADLQPTPMPLWIELQERLTAEPDWILDGDLGPFDNLDARLAKADAVVLFDLPTRVCVWRAFRRSRETIDFWRWLLTWRRKYLRGHLRAINERSSAELFVVRNQADLKSAMYRLSRLK
jgi:adenylate kinase family enzyme